MRCIDYKQCEISDGESDPIVCFIPEKDAKAGNALPVFSTGYFYDFYIICAVGKNKHYCRQPGNKYIDFSEGKYILNTA